MPAIGYVAKDENGTFKGQLRTLSIRAEISIVPNARKRNDVQPDYRIISGDVEIGAGWMRRSETSGRDYVSLSLAAPEFGPRRLYANLAPSADERDDRFASVRNGWNADARNSSLATWFTFCRSLLRHFEGALGCASTCHSPHRGWLPRGETAKRRAVSTTGIITTGRIQPATTAG